MALLTTVRPGQLITADNWNAMVAAVLGVTGQPSSGPIVVPSLFGLSLGNAVSILTLPATQLAVGTLLDSLGNSVDASLNDSKPLIVLSQMPSAGANVFAGSAVSLVVSPKVGSAPPPPKLPVIGGFGKPKVNIGDQLQIDGQNFEAGKTTVTFDGVAATPPNFPPGTPSQIFVSVPAGIPGAPVNPGDTKVVQVVVTTSSGASAAVAETILPPLANPLPTLAVFSLQPGRVGKATTVTGTGFDPVAAANNKLSFGGVSQNADSVASATQLSVTIPAGIPGMSSAGLAVSVTITVGGQTSPAASYFILS